MATKKAKSAGKKSTAGKVKKLEVSKNGDLGEKEDDFQEEDQSTNGKTTDELHDELKASKPKKLPGTVTIEKVKIDKNDHLTVFLTTIEADGTTTKDPGKGYTRPAHPDLKNAFAGFAVHMAVLSDYIGTKQIRDIKNFDRELIESFTVRSISLGGKVDEEGIVITGFKRTRRDKTQQLNTPFERLEEISETRYKFMDDVEEKLKVLLSEVEQYMAGTKVGAEAQQQIEFPEGDGDDFQFEEDK